MLGLAGTGLLLLLAIGVAPEAAHGSELRTRFIDPLLAFDSPNILRIATALTLSHTSQFATLGGSFKNAFMMYFNWLNRNQGGVKIQGVTYLVELTLIDDSSSKEVVTKITDYFIDQQNIKILLAPYSSGLTGMVASKVNATGAVLVAPGASLGSVFIGRPGVFGLLTPSTKYFIGGIELLKKAEGNATKTVALIQEDTKTTKGWCSGFQTLAASAGNLQMLANGQFTVPANALEEQVKYVVSNLSVLKPDIVVQCTYRIACHSLLRQMQSQRFEAKAIMATVCVTETDFLDVLGTAGQYIMGVAPWTADLPLTSALSPGWTAAKFASDYEAIHGGAPPYQAASAFGACEVLVKAIEDANSTDPSLIAAQLKIANHATIYGRIAFDANGQCTNEMKVAQFQFSPLKTLYPVENANGLIEYPKPTWAAMECANLDPEVKSRYGFVNGICEDCAVGRHSKVVNDTFGSLERRCLACEAGKVGLDAEYQFCLNCSEGSFSTKEEERNGGSKQCTQCAAGKYQDQEGQVNCTGCAAGTSQRLTGKSQCMPCLEGMYSEGGAESCTRCPIGEYSALPGVGSTTCSSCELFLPGSSTLFLGASSVDSCICMPGGYNGGPLHGNNRCTMCTEGMKCDAAGLLSPNQSLGYYLRDNTIAYECLIKGACPAGLPGQCNNGRVGLVCSQCPAGQVLTEGTCQDCQSAEVFLFLCVLIAVITGLDILHRLSNDKLMVDVSNALALSTSLGMLVTIFQLMATFNQLALPWPDSVQGPLKFPSFMIMDPDSIATECIFGSSPTTKYTLRLIVPYVIVFAILMLYVSTQLVFACLRRPEGFFNGRIKAWEFNKTLNTVGQATQALFIAFATVVALPFQCYTHPNGEKSIVTYPAVICGTGEQTILIVFAMVLVFTLLVPFLVLTFWANWVAPERSAAMQLSHLVRFRFLFYRFRPDRWWWGSVVAIRQLFLAVTPMVQPDDPYAQIMYVLTVLLMYITAASIMWPWKSHELNIIEIASLVFVALFMAVIGAFVPRTQNDGTYTALMMMWLGLILLIKIPVIVLASTSILLKGLGGTFGMQYKASPSQRLELALTWQKFCAQFSSMDHDQIAQLFSFMSSFDRQAIVGVMRASCATNTQELYTTPQLALRRIANIPTLASAQDSPGSSREFWNSFVRLSSSGTSGTCVGTKQDSKQDVKQDAKQDAVQDAPEQPFCSDEVQEQQSAFEVALHFRESDNLHIETEVEARPGMPGIHHVIFTTGASFPRSLGTPRGADKDLGTPRAEDADLGTPRAEDLGTPRAEDEDLAPSTPR